jgi:hypothetical protein
MSSPTIAAFLFDDENVEKLAKHGLTDMRVDQVLDGDILVARNKKAGRGSHLIIGHDHGGAQILVVVEPTSDAIVWRVVTAWIA